MRVHGVASQYAMKTNLSDTREEADILAMRSPGSCNPHFPTARATFPTVQWMDMFCMLF